MNIKNLIKKETPLILKIGNENSDLTIINNMIVDFFIEYSKENDKFFLNYITYASVYKKLAVLDGDDDFFNFIKNKEIDGKEVDRNFFKIFELACDNIKLKGDGHSIYMNRYNDFAIKKESFIELCGYIDGVVDVNYGLNKLSEVFKEAKQEYLDQQLLLEEIDANQNPLSKHNQYNI